MAMAQALPQRLIGNAVNRQVMAVCRFVTSDVREECNV